MLTQDAPKLRDFIKKQMPLINLSELSRKAMQKQRLRRFVNGLDHTYWSSDIEAVNKQLVVLYESLGKYLTDNKVIEPKGLFK